jgi:hypothetical protein
LVEENELLKKRLRAIETIVNSGNQEYLKERVEEWVSDALVVPIT